MAIDARLLVLDEPTLGLDILYRKQFYDSLLNDYFDRSRTIVVATHQVEEVQHVLTDLMFINRGRIVFDRSMEELESRYLEVMVRPEQVAAARALKPMHERQAIGRSILLFDLKPDGVASQKLDRQQLAALGEVRTPSIADLFVAVMDNQGSQPRRRSGSMSTQSNAMPESLPIAKHRARRSYRRARASVLVGAPRIVGEPFHLSCAAGRRRASHSVGFSLSSICGYLGKNAEAESGTTSGALRHGGRSDDADRDRRECVLLSRRAARRAPRSQHSVLEVAAGFRSHHGAVEGEHSARRSAADHLCDHGRHAVDHAAGEQRRTAGKRSECGDPVDELIVPREMWVLLLYHLLTAHALWPFPVYCWLLLVSGWARRAAFLWAILPLVAIGGVEMIAFGTWHFAILVGSRLIGDAPTVAATSHDMFPTNPMTHIAPGQFLTSPGLWIGLAFAAACLAAAVRLRRSQEPI